MAATFRSRQGCGPGVGRARAENAQVCDPEIYRDLTRTPAMQKRLLAMGLMKLVVKPPSQKEQLEHSVRNHSGRFDREKLYKEVWAEPVALVAGSYSVSGVYLARVCRQLQVPVPPRGYWARVRSGQRVRKAKLPSLKGSRG